MFSLDLMRSLPTLFAVGMLATSVVGEPVEFVIHANDVLSVCADDVDVEIVTCHPALSAVPNELPRLSPPIGFAFPLAPSADIVQGLYVRSITCTTSGTWIIRLRFKDSKSATAVAAFIDEQRTSECNPPMPPNPDGPYAMGANPDLTRR